MKEINKRRCVILFGSLFIIQDQDAFAKEWLSMNQLAPVARMDQNNLKLYLELVINLKPSGRIIVVDYYNHHYFIRKEDLYNINIPEKILASAHIGVNGNIAVDTIKGVSVKYNQTAQLLFIDVPPAWLPEQYITSSNRNAYYPAQSSVGALFSYDVYASKPDHSNHYIGAWNELRFFSQYGILNNSGIYRHNESGSDTGYLRYDTRYQYSDVGNIRTYEVGDFITRSLSWSNVLRLGGIQISRNFSLRPDIITYPLPRFSGEVAVPSAVELFIDGYRLQNGNIDPGPFNITNMPYINGAGEAVIVTTDALGRKVSTAIPFYVANTLLSSNLSDYSFALGSIRRYYGRRNADYGRLALTGNYRYGLNDYLTLESHLEGTDEIQMLGIGGVAALDNAGTVNLSYAQDRDKDLDAGRQITASYQYIHRHFNFYMQQTWRDANYRDITNRYHNYHLNRQTTQITANTTLREFGTVSVGYFALKFNTHKSTQLINVSWSYSLNDWGIFYASATHTNNDDKWSGFLQLVIPLGRNSGDFISASTEYSAEHRWSETINYSHTLPTDGGLGWNLSYTHHKKDRDYSQANLAWQNDYNQLNVGLFGSTNNKTYWAGIKGTLAYLDHQLFSANFVHDSFVVISTEGIAGVPVRYENNLVGRTNYKGHLFIPSTPSYYAAKYEIDPLHLPLNLHFDKFEQRVAVQAGCGYLLRFPIRRITAGNIALIDKQGRVLPVGSLVMTKTGESNYVGWGGMTYLEGLLKDNHLQVKFPNGKKCQAYFSLTEQQINENEIQNIGPLLCFGADE